MSRTTKKRKNVTFTHYACSRCEAKCLAHIGVRGKPHRRCERTGTWGFDK